MFSPPLLGGVLERGSGGQAPAMLPVGISFGAPPPQCRLPSPRPPGQRKLACLDPPCGSWSLQSCLPLSQPQIQG